MRRYNPKGGGGPRVLLGSSCCHQHHWGGVGGGPGGLPAGPGARRSGQGSLAPAAWLVTPAGAFCGGAQVTARRSVKLAVAPVKTEPELRFHKLHGRGWSRRSSTAPWLPVSVPCAAAAPGNNLFLAAGSGHAALGEFLTGCAPRTNAARAAHGAGINLGHNAELHCSFEAGGKGPRCRGPQPPSRPLFPRGHPHVSCWEQPLRRGAWQGP